ncbi:MAG: thiamine phosphate synthase [Nitrospirae bacterium]|nr:thiamine phosphate synthase [Nitrospirota bacterium]
MTLMDFKLYLITDRELFSGSEAFFEAVESALQGGVKVVQLREKDLSARALLSMAYRIRELTMKYRAKLLINDRADIALCAGADGVHLSQGSMPAFAIRRIAGDSFFIGCSAHSLEEARLCEKEGADFITFGPLYQTPSKLKYGAPVGVEALKKVREEIAVPVFGIGGIKCDSIKPVMDAGAHGIAVISGILAEKDIKGAAERYLKEIKNAGTGEGTGSLEEGL